MSPAWFGCADGARLRDDPLVATAPYAAGWLLIEHPGPWAADALAGSGLSAGVRSALSAAAARARVRILLIRRPGRPPRTGAPPLRRWAVTEALPHPGRVHWGEWARDSDLLAADEQLSALSTTRNQRPDGPAGTDAAPHPLLLVCTHGMHDTCCAVRGRPVAAALAERWPEATWECSHLGGDRFAPNLLVLPDGTHYGKLDAHQAVPAVEAHLGGRLALDHLRGVATMPPPAQAAAADLHRRHGPWAPGAVRPLHVRAEGPSGPWLVTLVSPVGQRRARVVALPRPSARLTCQAAAATSATAYLVTWTAAVTAATSGHDGV